MPITRYYSSTAAKTTLSSAVDSSTTSTSFSLAAATGLPSQYPYTLILEKDTANEEIIEVTGKTGTTFTATRGVDGSTAKSHSVGATVEHGVSARDFAESRTHEAATNAHGVTGDVVGTGGAQTLTGKTLTSAVLGNDLSAGGFKITNLATPTSSSDAVRKDFADAQVAAAATSAASAAVSASSAATSASSALTSQGSAAVSASSAATSATAAATSAASAATSATAAATSAASALASQTAAATSAASALASQTAAATSASSAATSATAAATSATSAAASATAAAASATTAAASAATATTSASQAATSATNAAGSATAAATSATSAAASATAAAASATTASNSAATATTSASQAATSASSAATSATAAATSASSAATSATAAATSASSAATSASSAATSAAAAATSYDDFDDRYLGAKASPPSLDNDGNALLTGALYWNTSTNKMFVWSGSAWTEISSSADIIAYKYTVANGATSVSGADDNGLTLSYLVGKEQVYINGVLQVRGSDYTASTGSSITGITAMATSDVVVVLAFSAFNVANTININTLNAKGDVLTATASSTPARLAVGSNDQVLVADSSTASGLAWKSYGAQVVAGKNYFLNSGMEIWQRGTSFTSPAGAYTADRWKATVNGAGTYVISRQSTGLAGLPYCLRFQRSAGQTYAAYGTFLGYAWETDAMIGLQGKTVTYSVYARKGANHSDSNGAAINLWWGTGSGTHAFSSLTNEVNAITGALTLTTSWQRFTFTGTIPSNATELRTNISWQTTGTAGADDYVELTGLQLEVGSVATPFSRAGINLGAELALCQRYFQALTWGPTYNTAIHTGHFWSSTKSLGTVHLKQTMRTTPAITLSSASHITVYSANGTYAVSSMNADALTSASIDLEFVTSSAGTAGYGTFNRITNASGYIWISAEL